MQAMAGASDKILNNLETYVKKLPSIGEFFAEEKIPEDLINNYLGDLSPKILANHRVEFFCRCKKETILNMLSMFKIEDLKDMYEKGPFPIETTCHNCNTLYTFSKKEIETLYNKRARSKD